MDEDNNLINEIDEKVQEETRKRETVEQLNEVLRCLDALEKSLEKPN